MRVLLPFIFITLLALPGCADAAENRYFKDVTDKLDVLELNLENLRGWMELERGGGGRINVDQPVGVITGELRKNAESLKSIPAPDSLRDIRSFIVKAMEKMTEGLDYIDKAYKIDDYSYLDKASEAIDESVKYIVEGAQLKNEILKKRK